MDLAIDEVTTISEIIQEAAGEEAEIIFGAVHDPTMQEEVRVTVIATGFDRAESRDGVIRPAFGTTQKRSEPARGGYAQAEPIRAVVGGGSSGSGGNSSPRPQVVRPPERRLQTDLEIPTFIRRQMD